jgi:membrane protease YdiL (CAAX protease family)
MRFSVRAFFGCVLAAIVILGSAWAAAPLHQATVALGLLDENDFLRVFRRIGMAGLLAVLAWTLRPWSDGNLGSYGIRLKEITLRRWARFYAIAAFAVLMILVFHFAVGHLQWREEIDWPDAARRASWYLVAGVIIAAIEELIFRGWMQRRAEGAMSPTGAAVFCSVAYALVHSFRARHLADEVTHDWRGALAALAGWLEELLHLERVGPPMIGLFLFGFLLAAITRIHGTVMPAIAIHAGATLILYSHGSFTTRVTGPLWAGTKSLYDGAPVWLLLLAVLLIIQPRVPVDDRVARPAAAEPG